MIPHLQAPLSFIKTRQLSRQGSDRASFERKQERLLKNWMTRALPKVRAFADRPAELDHLPKMDKAQLMRNFEAYNQQAFTADQVRDAMTRDYRIGSFTVGASTGTSGNRGLFVISDAERYRWLGCILAKTMSDLLMSPQRVAIILPQGTALYSSANVVLHLRLKFFDLTAGPEHWRAALERFAPTVLVAPPKALRHLAETEARLSPIRVFSAAETLDPVDRPVIEAAFGKPLEQIYMATEGLLGVTCRHGHLHLAEESVFFEFEPVGEGLVSPLISSFRRETQILARYRMNDLLRLDPAPCPCGSPLQRVSDIVGRMDDCFHLRGPSGLTLVTPDILRNAVLDADRRISDFRLVQDGQDTLTLILPPHTEEVCTDAAVKDLRALLDKRGLRAQIRVSKAPLSLDVTRKLRRVECRVKATQ